ncbi:hypothetical protein ACFQU3_19300 [Terrabacter sp. GCM10028922]|uniref:hypothetical protein n=1 Tax=Terrabacter sp. GCM10028922 TaxID=3273428 RepID=UPI003620D5B2
MVRRALDVPDARPLEWSCEPLDVELVNPLTAGLYRVVGTAQVVPGPARPWRVILKVIQHPDFTGTALEFGYAELPGDWNYWRREVLAYRSGLPDRFTWPLRPVRCWGTEDIDDTTAWLWLEELDTTSRRPHWSLEELAVSAHDWGAFSAQGLAMVGDVESLPWAARRWLRGWVGTARVLGADHAVAHDGCWDHPLLRERLPASARASFAELMGVAEPLLDRLHALPRTVAHHDTQWHNVFCETGPEGRRTVAIDWSFLGTAPVGEDLGHHIAVNLFLGAVQPSDAEEHDETAAEAYLAGLRAYGWRGDDKDVRLAAAATGALQMLSYAACFIARLCPDFGEVYRWPEEMAEKQSGDVDAVMDTWCETFRFLLTLGERATRSVVDH